MGTGGSFDRNLIALVDVAFMSDLVLWAMSPSGCKVKEWAMNNLKPGEFYQHLSHMGHALCHFHMGQKRWK